LFPVLKNIDVAVMDAGKQKKMPLLLPKRVELQAVSKKVTTRDDNDAVDNDADPEEHSQLVRRIPTINSLPQMRP